MKKYIYLFCLCVQLVSCQNKTVKLTPKEFISKVEVSEKKYSQDSIKLTELIQKEIKEHKGDYYAKSYDEHTEIIIDSIIYSPDNKKIFFFIINKVENKKVYPDDLTPQEIEKIVKETELPYEGYHYEGKAYIGVREGVDNLIINNFFRINTAKYNTIKEVRTRLNQLFFEEYSAVNEKGYEYNPDDIRFWENKNVWNFN